MIYFCVKFQKDPLFGVNLTLFAPWLPWQRPPFWILFNPSKAATHYGGYSYKVSWTLMKGIQKKIKSLLFYFHGNCGKVCLTDSDFFGLSRSTICGFVLIKFHQVLLASNLLWSFVFFIFFSIFAVSMATAAILKKINP